MSIFRTVNLNYFLTCFNHIFKYIFNNEYCFLPCTNNISFLKLIDFVLIIFLNIFLTVNIVFYHVQIIYRF